MSTPESREKAVFYAALDITDPGERRRFLAEACAGDEELRTAVEELLKAQADAERFFAEGASSLMPLIGDMQSTAALEDERDGTAFEEAPGTVLGRYKVIEKLGEGGFGVVYQAEQEEPVRRRVALKVIKLGMDTKSVIARFEAERQALAMMEHPNIARVFDAGATETGRPYFVMELVHGVKITEYCDQHQLGMEQRLELFIQICQAIQHAHQKGIIHRDIKPSNILVTLHEGTPVPKVIDFGIAKATEEPLTDRTLLTVCAQWIGTPAYMSPEQMELSSLDLDTRSDIYSLGVLLYELLTGQTPFDMKELLSAGVDEMRRTLRVREPCNPSAKLHTLNGKDLETTASRRQVDPARLVSQVRGDLDWIVMKALEKDRSRRYETANALAMDIQRYLDNEPVLARPPNRWYLLKKLVRRNRLAFASGAAVVAALLVGTVTSTWLYLQEREALRRVVEAERVQGSLKAETESVRAKELAARNEFERRKKFSQVVSLVAQKRYAEAENLLGTLELKEPSNEAAEALRMVGHWRASNGQWPEAAQWLAPLVKMDRLNDPEFATMDYLHLGPALVNAGELNSYERSRQEAIARFSDTTSPLASRVIKFSLLLPSNQEMIRDLLPQAQALEMSLPAATDSLSRDGFMAAWHSVALGLFEYRRGDFARAAAWCRRCLDYPEYAGYRNATANAILAMSRWQMNQKEEALSALWVGRRMINDQFKPARGVSIGPPGYWFDQEYGRILLRECEDRFAEADRTLAQLPVPAPLGDAAATYRVLGNWHALRQEWSQATERLRPLLTVNPRSRWEQVSYDYLACATTLIESGDAPGYESFRGNAIAGFKDSDSRVVAERVIKISLLLPADEKILASLSPLAEVAARPFTSAEGRLKEDASFNAWNFMTLALLEYRHGNHAKAIEFSHRSLATADKQTLPGPIARVILAMSLHQSGQGEPARSELLQARDILENGFKTEPDQYSWRDWLFGRILAREAGTLLGLPAK